MKKIIIICFILLTTSCGTKEEKFECKLNSADGSNRTVNIIIENKIVKSADMTLAYETEEDANNMCQILNAAGDSKGKVDCNKNIIKVNDYHKSLNKSDLSKDDILKYLENLNYVCNNKK